MESLLREKQAAEVLNVSRSFLQKGPGLRIRAGLCEIRRCSEVPELCT